MRYERTRRMKRAGDPESLPEFLEAWQPSIVVLSGDASGREYELDRTSISLGRGPGADLAFDDSAMSRVHAAFEFAQGGFRIHDLGSTNGTSLNDADVKVADLKNGDRIRVGEHEFQFVLEKRRRKPKTYTLPDG